MIQNCLLIQLARSCSPHSRIKKHARRQASHSILHTNGRPAGLPNHPSALPKTHGLRGCGLPDRRVGHNRNPGRNLVRVLPASLAPDELQLQRVPAEPETGNLPDSEAHPAKEVHGASGRHARILGLLSA